MSRKALALAAFLFLGIGGTGAKADPIITPLLISAGATIGITGTAGAVTAPIAPYGIKAPK